MQYIFEIKKQDGEVVEKSFNVHIPEEEKSIAQSFLNIEGIIEVTSYPEKDRNLPFIEKNATITIKKLSKQ